MLCRAVNPFRGAQQQPLCNCLFKTIRASSRALCPASVDLIPETKVQLILGSNQGSMWTKFLWGFCRSGAPSPGNACSARPATQWPSRVLCGVVKACCIPVQETVPLMLGMLRYTSAAVGYIADKQVITCHRVSRCGGALLTAQIMNTGLVALLPIRKQTVYLRGQ